MQPKLCILAGGGILPKILIEACQRDGRPFYVLAFRGQADADIVSGVPHAWVRLGGVGRIFRLLKSEGISDVVMAGTMVRPSFLSLLPDLKALGILLKLGGLGGGDNRLLSTLINELETEGFHAVGSDEIAPDLIAKKGAYGTVMPDKTLDADVSAAVGAALDIGRADVGQGAVARGGIVIATEDRSGTNAMLARVGAEGGGPHKGIPGGILAKTMKPGQDRRADLPTIGVETVRRAAEAGLAGIVVEAGHALVIDADAVGHAADEAGLFVVGIDPADVLNRRDG